jgi:hypothetical protein
VRQSAFPNVQEARYQFLGYVQIADAPVIRTTRDAKRLSKTRQQYEQRPPPEKKA